MRDKRIVSVNVILQSKAEGSHDTQADCACSATLCPCGDVYFLIGIASSMSMIGISSLIG
jgi:hypothetical protein